MESSPTPASGTSVTINDTAPTTDSYNLSVVEVLPSLGPYGISGNISPTLSGATVTLSGPANAATSTDASGNYSFIGLPNGSYTLTPSETGISFTPASQTVTINGSSLTGVNFVGLSTPVLSVSPTAVPFSATVGGSNPLPATVNVTNTGTGALNFTASSDSTWLGVSPGSGTAPQSLQVSASITGLAAGTYTGHVTVTSSGSQNSPATITVTLTVSSASTWTISGNVSANGANASVSLSGAASASTTADSSGNYSFTGLANGTYTVTPTKSGFTFNPTSQATTVSNGNVSNLNFTASSSSTGLAIDVNTSADGTSAKTTIATQPFSTKAGNELLLAFVATDYLKGTNTTVTAMTGGGVTWSLVKRTNVQSGDAEIWAAFASSALTNVTVTATVSQSVVTSMTVMSFTGVDTTQGASLPNAVGATGTGNSSKGAPTASLVTTRNNSWVFGVGNDYDSAIARTPGTGQTIVHQLLTSTGDTYWVQMQNATTPLSGTTVTINDTAPTTDRYNLTTVEVRAP